MPSARTNGITTHYEDSGGAGPVVVLIHGHSVDLRMWPAQVAALKEAGYRAVRYDVRGHGFSSAPAGGYTWSAYSRDLLSLLKALEVRTAHLVGFSMGGGIALHTALDRPDLVRSLTMIDAAVPGFAYSEDFAQRVEELVDAVRAEGWRVPAERLWLTHPMFERVRRRPALFAAVRDLVLQYPARDYLIEQLEADEADAVSRLPGLRAPALVLVGEHDLEDFRLAAEVVAENAPAAHLMTVPDAGHLAPLEQPDVCNRLLLEFLDAVERAV